MNNYESMIIFAPELTEEDIKKENQKISDMIGKLQGNIVNTEYWGKRNLAYLINKKREGHYLVNYIALPPTETSKLERFYVLAESILRYNLLKIDTIPDNAEKEPLPKPNTIRNEEPVQEVSEPAPATDAETE